jgi:AcrR family transcriptional regulator
VTDIQAEKEKILKFTQNKFINEGFYKTTMDEIATELQMSKKTIYKYFPSKEKLVEEISEDFITCATTDLDDIIHSRDNVIVKFVKLLNMYSSRMMSHSDKWYRDLQLHMPHIWHKVDKFRTERILSITIILLEQGRKEKLIEPYPPEIIIASFISTIRAVVNPEFILMNKFSMQEAFKYTFEMLLNGILTEQGKEKYLKTKKLFETEVKR